MHALTFHKTCAGSPTTEKKGKITKHNEVRVKLKNFSGGFAANSLKHLIVPNCLEDRTHTEAIRMICMGNPSQGNSIQAKE